MKNVITVDDFFSDFKDELPINKINSKLNELITEKKIILLDDKSITTKNTDIFNSKLENVKKIVDFWLELIEVAFIVDINLLKDGKIDKYSLLYYLQKENFLFEIMGIIVSKGFKIRIWKEEKLSLEQIEERFLDKDKLLKVLETEYFISKNDLKYYKKSKGY